MLSSFSGTSRDVEPREMSCKELVELVTEYFDDVLAPEDRAAFERHLGECDPCVDYLAEMRDTIRLTGRLREESLPPQLRDELLTAFRGLRRP
jgi:anti-sigma factor RsiW